MKKILIKKGKLPNGKIVDIELEDITILRIDENIEIAEHEEVIDLNGEKYVSSGWIDMHTHCFNKFELYSDKPDEIGYKNGVTTVVDAGTAGADTIGEFYNEAKLSKTNVLAYINIARQGIASQNELADMNKLDKKALAKAYKSYSEFIVGIKARMSKTVIGENGLKPLEAAKEAGEYNSLPVMVHIGSEPPILSDILSMINEGDIISHVFNGKPNGIADENLNIKTCLVDAYERGVYLDLAHGTDSFNFNVCEAAKNINVKCHAISTDIYKKNRVNGPVFDLATTMSKLLVLGYTVEEIIDRVTKFPAKIIRRDNIGDLKVGNKSDITIFDIVNEEKELMDSNKGIKKSSKVFKPLAVVLNGEYIKLS